MDRREFTRYVLLGSYALRVKAASAGRVVLYFVDGYHGGVRGHMPSGAWRDILTRIGSTPEWKLCLDIEAASWKALKNRDPQSYAKITEHLNEPSARVEMVGGTFSQPYGWALTGESNIRQLVRGLEVIRESFPDLKVNTYAVQEPCWASCLPQILVSLGFDAAVLKNPSTAWGGYSVGIDAETVNWVGPDGTRIRTVPRYACEELVDTWRTEAQAGSEEFAKKCIEHGIEHPAGMCFQDLGWAARPTLQGDYIRFVTWREYMQSVAGKTTRDWRFSMEDIRCALPWGEKTLQKITRQVRSAENKLIATEKISSLAAVCGGLDYPVAELQQAWDQILWARHHDAWITATTRTGRDAWAFQVAAQTWEAEVACDELIERSLDKLTGRQTADENVLKEESVLCVFNTHGYERAEVVEVPIATDIGTKSVQVFDDAGREVVSQFEVTRKYIPETMNRVRGDAHSSELKPGESIGAGRLLFRSIVPPTGRAAYRVKTSADSTRESQLAGVTAKRSADGPVLIESDLYKVRIEPARGGILSSVYVKDLEKEFCATGDRAFHEFRGFFIEEKAWHSSTENPATVDIIEPGPLRVTVLITGKVESVPFRSSISVTQGQRRIDFHTQFHFERDTWIGDPWEIEPAQRMTGRRRSEYDDRYKLLALFPVAFSQEAIYKNAAFDVCRSENVNTFFNSWDSIKHNIILNWVDLMDEKDKIGLALLTDHTTSYGHGKNHPLSLVMAWGWDGGFWWGKCPLNGIQEARYAVVPHSGHWEEAALWSEVSEWSEPPLVAITSSSTALLESRGTSLLKIETPGVQLSAMTVSGRDLLLRLFNARSEKEDHTIRLGVHASSIELVELDGRQAALIHPDRDARGERIRVTIPKFGLAMVRLRDVVA